MLRFTLNKTHHAPPQSHKIPLPPLSEASLLFKLMQNQHQTEHALMPGLEAGLVQWPAITEKLSRLNSFRSRSTRPFQLPIQPSYGESCPHCDVNPPYLWQIHGQQVKNYSFSQQMLSSKANVCRVVLRGIGKVNVYLYARAQFLHHPHFLPIKNWALHKNPSFPCFFPWNLVFKWAISSLAFTLQEDPCSTS